ncbi:phosphoserine phosphatase SerB [Quadrisphaera granulorum]|uniref:Lysine N-acyltransferase MbtK n=1 Tax=Quadrisphaera granulorum TaxID=317664 RepID=A0A316A0T1_9ACTN|nr:phosphoserine phosphatase SerB [Quadrisphaera granulorum]PWJ50690.1 phosphoserine phosphatase SerB [Quadrisphaera granulorum]SZE97938.1 phosphoserine phosphatase SerB [Quadrisphaera granulorum]
MPQPATQHHSTLLATFTGTDRPGVTAAVLGALAGRGLEVLDVEQHVVRGHLTLALLTTCGASRGDEDDDGDRVAELESALRAAAARFDLDVTITPGGSSDDPAVGVVVPSGPRSHVTVLAAPLRPEQLALVAGTVAEAGASIDAVRRLATATPDHPVTCLELDVRGAEPAALRRELATVAASAGVDVAVSPAGLVRHGRRLVVLDVDSTLIQDEVIELIAAHAGPEAQRAVAEVTERAMRGELDFAESLHERVKALAGLDARVLADVRAAVRLTPGAEVLCSVLQRLGFVMALVSGGFAEVVEPLAASLGIARVRANRLEVIDGKLTGRVLGEVVDRAGKASALREFARAERLDLDRTVAVGDGANDLDMIAAAGLGVAFNAKPLVREQADTSLNNPYLDSVLHLLGISREEADEVQTSRDDDGELRGPVALRPLRRDDFPLLASWLDQPRVARWWPDAHTLEDLELDYGPGIDGTDPIHLALALTAGGRAFGFVQTYRYDDEPESRAALEALLPVPPGALGIDYLIGEPDLQGRGLGAAVISAAVAEGLVRHPDAPEVLVSVPLGNRASWRALEKAGFERAAEGDMVPDNPLDPHDHVVYRLTRIDGRSTSASTSTDSGGAAGMGV